MTKYTSTDYFNGHVVSIVIGKQAEHFGYGFPVAFFINVSHSQDLKIGRVRQSNHIVIKLIASSH